MVLRKIFIFIFFISTAAISSVHNPGYYGQKDFSLYSGSRELFFQADPYQGEIQFEENKLFKEYIDNLISPELKDYQKFFNQELHSSLSCPQSEMDKMYNYLRFSNRVIALSYIYESIRLQKLTGQKLGAEKNCVVDWQRVLNQCRPKSKDMKIFVKSAKHIAKNERASFVDVSHSIKKYRKHWENHFKKKKYDDISHYRVKMYCDNEYCDKNVTADTAIKIMNKSCQKDTKAFIKICSELDNIYGMSTIYEVYPLLANSDILTLFNQNGHALGCLRRFRQQNRTREVQNKLLSKIFPIVYQQMSNDPERFPQGSIFFAGTLRQFVDKGLDDIYRTEKKVAVKKKIQNGPVIFKKKIEDKVEFVNRIVKKKKKRNVVKKIKVKKKKKLPKKSSFLLAVEMQQNFDMDKVKVDMRSFKYDFLFSLALKKILDKNLTIYTTRKGLEQMKKYDKLGTSSGPVPLMFIKYLIETHKHQALFNITSVVGTQFFVNNDIDKLSNTQFDYIELQNDESSNNSWQINVLREPQQAEEEAPPLIQP